ncbi:hypothetical protein D3C86_1627210 [compost metagenome]
MLALTAAPQKVGAPEQIIPADGDQDHVGLAQRIFYAFLLEPALQSSCGHAVDPQIADQIRFVAFCCQAVYCALYEAASLVIARSFSQRVP